MSLHTNQHNFSGLSWPSDEYREDLFSSFINGEEEDFLERSLKSGTVTHSYIESVCKMTFLDDLCMKTSGLVEKAIPLTPNLHISMALGSYDKKEYKDLEKLLEMPAFPIRTEEKMSESKKTEFVNQFLSFADGESKGSGEEDDHRKSDSDEDKAHHVKRSHSKQDREDIEDGEYGDGENGMSIGQEGMQEKKKRKRGRGRKHSKLQKHSHSRSQQQFQTISNRRLSNNLHDTPPCTPGSNSLSSSQTVGSTKSNNTGKTTGPKKINVKILKEEAMPWVPRIYRDEAPKVNSKHGVSRAILNIFHTIETLNAIPKYIVDVWKETYETHQLRTQQFECVVEWIVLEIIKYSEGVAKPKGPTSLRIICMEIVRELNRIQICKVITLLQLEVVKLLLDRTLEMNSPHSSSSVMGEEEEDVMSEVEDEDDVKVQENLIHVIESKSIVLPPLPRPRRMFTPNVQLSPSPLVVQQQNTIPMTINDVGIRSGMPDYEIENYGPDEFIIRSFFIQNQLLSKFQIPTALLESVRVSCSDQTSPSPPLTSSSREEGGKEAEWIYNIPRITKETNLARIVIALVILCNETRRIPEWMYAPYGMELHGPNPTKLIHHFQFIHRMLLLLSIRNNFKFASKAIHILCSELCKIIPVTMKGDLLGVVLESNSKRLN